jgi:ribose/xylose/arabinose/galactoside ABC-type transport system permease subunit
LPHRDNGQIGSLPSNRDQVLAGEKSRRQQMGAPNPGAFSCVRAAFVDKFAAIEHQRAGTLVGVVNGIGVAVFNVSPFMMTLGTAAISFGIALTLTSGVPVYGLPDAFETIFNFSRIFDIPSPVYVTAGLFLVMHVFLNRTRMGRYFYAVGGNLKASRLSGIDARFYLFWLMSCAVLWPR